MIPVFKKGWLAGKTSLNLSSPMGMRNGRMHNGIDIPVPVNSKIYAPIGGRVMQISVQKAGAGLYLKLRYYYEANNYYDLVFMHLHATAVSQGQTVSEGDLIAYSGGDVSDTPNCGRSTGPHLHFEIRKGSVAVNPMPFLSETCTWNGKVVHQGRAFATLSENIDDSAANYQQTDITSGVDPNAIEQDVVTKTTTKTGAVGERLAPGIWQITKLLMDSSVSQRQIFDSSISMQTGPLINFFNKVCQQPFVELSGDTFGDQYYFMVRKPPYDKEGMKKMQSLVSYLIDESEIMSTNIGWANTGIYSWYQLIPFAEFGGLDQTMLYMPAIFFPEYAAIWGSKQLVIQSQYVNFYMSGYWNQTTDEEKKRNGENIIKNAVRDLKYLIESNAYNPFTRAGTIVLNGDRRIKRGTLIIMPNNEQFYVDGVANSFSVSGNSVERTTTLTVSRGMFQEFIDGVEVNGDLMSYFNLIDFGEDFDVNDVTVEEWKKILSKWKVNVNVFAFFLKRSQMLSNLYTNKQ